MLFRHQTTSVDEVGPASPPVGVTQSMAENASDDQCSMFGSNVHKYFENVSFFGGLDGSKQPQTSA